MAELGFIAQLKGKAKKMPRLGLEDMELLSPVEILNIPQAKVHQYPISFTSRFMESVNPIGTKNNADLHSSSQSVIKSKLPLIKLSPTRQRPELNSTSKSVLALRRKITANPTHKLPSLYKHLSPIRKFH